MQILEHIQEIRGSDSEIQTVRSKGTSDEIASLKRMGERHWSK